MKKAAESEDDFASWVEDCAALGHWLVYHTYDSRRSRGGFPDYVMVRGRRVIFAEIKSEDGQPSPMQEAWLGALRQCSGVETHLWRPSDRPMILVVLR